MKGEGARAEGSPLPASILSQGSNLIVSIHAALDDARLLLDVGGGTGIYSIAYLQQHPGLRAIVWDRPEFFI